ncbi:hypothetical protein DFP72DRAFT_856442 [Ephemerocybe angulata]|uniref:Uncharacterized protein n=1 Tax=Ephemerocybe angulata TaxID=980116 RepID=A0A8H6HG20_9AGAR|nr:hypothetical protein DFP72DRAFT_856442 [Tulosesus angulatus]
MSTRIRSLTAIELPMLPRSVIDALEGQKDTMVGILVASAQRPNISRCSNCIEQGLLCPGRTEALGCISSAAKVKRRSSIIYNLLPTIQEEIEGGADARPSSPRPFATPSSTHGYESDESGSSSTGSELSAGDSGHCNDEEYEMVPSGHHSQTASIENGINPTVEDEDHRWIHVGSFDSEWHEESSRHSVGNGVARTSTEIAHPPSQVSTYSSLLSALDELQDTGNLPELSTPRQMGATPVGDWDLGNFISALGNYDQTIFQPIPYQYLPNVITTGGVSTTSVAWPPQCQVPTATFVETSHASASSGQQSQGGTTAVESYDGSWTDPRCIANNPESWGPYGAYAY